MRALELDTSLTRFASLRAHMILQNFPLRQNAENAKGRS
jgi:hypothetical protein